MHVIYQERDRDQNEDAKRRMLSGSEGLQTRGNLVQEPRACTLDQRQKDDREQVQTPSLILINNKFQQHQTFTSLVMTKSHQISISPDISLE